jgi:hypothetical protein
LLLEERTWTLKLDPKFMLLLGLTIIFNAEAFGERMNFDVAIDAW